MTTCYNSIVLSITTCHIREIVTYFMMLYCFYLQCQVSFVIDVLSPRLSLRVTRRVPLMEQKMLLFTIPWHLRLPFDLLFSE
jgi:hypothetical protein